MKKNILGETGIEVTELCFGALPMGPLQKNLPVEECAEILKAALCGGVNFIDTAQGYRTYEPIRLALKEVKKRPIIASKAPAESYEGMQKAIDQALNDLDLDYIDIFHLHAARAGEEVFEVRRGALECLLDNKRKGLVKAMGISTHSVKATSLAAKTEEMDVVFPLINKTGLGIIDGNREEMEKAISECVSQGKGVYLMKVLAGGSLVVDYGAAVDYARSIPGCSSIAIGMVNEEEVQYNLAYFEGQRPKAPPSLEAMKKRFIVVNGLCAGCFQCLETCPNHAIIRREGKAFIQDGKCLTCGYCVDGCPEFAIRLV